MSSNNQSPDCRRSSKYGWTPDLPDHRDHSFKPPRRSNRKLPSLVDLRAKCPPVYDQGAINSCTANAIAAAIQFDRLKQNLPDFTPSRLFIYYNERVVENKVAIDGGAQIRDGIKSVSHLGAPPEDQWPYLATPPSPKTHVWPPTAAPFKKPFPKAYRSALKYKSVTYSRVDQDIMQFKKCLASTSPFVFGFSVYNAFESAQVAKSGKLSLPHRSEQMIGGHAVLAVGYDDSKKVFIVRNSWGSHWGMGGYFTMPYAYLLSSHLSRDFWVIRTVD